MKKFISTPLVVCLAVVALAVGSSLATAQERGSRGPGMRGPGMPGRGPGIGGPGIVEAFDQIDKNADGKVSKDEASEWFWQRLARADADSDSALTRKELEAVRGPGQPGGPGRGMWPRPGRPMRGATDTASFERSTLPKTETEKKILGVLEDMYQNQGRRMMNVPPEDGRLLRLLTETVDAKHVVEIGTSNGYSAIWLCLALRTTGGKLTTHEINAGRASLARENFKRAGVDQIVTLVEGDAHEEVTKLKEPIDVLFLDADKEGYIDYLNKLLPLVRPGGLILAHNMSPRQADPRYVEAITTNPDLETIFLHMEGAGVGVTLKKR